MSHLGSPSRIELKVIQWHSSKGRNMASHVQGFLKGAKGLKFKELAPYASKYSKEHLTYSKLQPQVKSSLDVSRFQSL